MTSRIAVLLLCGVVFCSSARAADPGGQAWGFGFDCLGALGDGSSGRPTDSGWSWGVYDYTYSPVPTAGLPANVTRIDSGWYHNSVAVTADGDVFTCGSHHYDVLLGRPADGWQPIWGQVTGLPPVKDVAAGFQHDVVLTDDGRVFAWGKNDYGQLGDGTRTHRGTPVQVVGLTNILAVGAGWWHSVALRDDGKVFVWGYNGDGEFGRGDTSAGSTVPQEVPGVTTARAIATGMEHLVAALDDGTVMAWGGIWYGGHLVPTPVAGLANVETVAAGYSNNLAILTDGSVVEWEFSSLPPVPVPGLTDVIAVAVGSGYALAVKDDLTLWGWGWNLKGELGDGTGEYRSVPTRNRLITGVTAIAAGYEHSFAVGPPDSDGDGVNELVENGAPNDGDGNLDGTLDGEQANVTSLPNAVDGAYITLFSPGGTVMERVFSTAGVWPSPPEDVVFPVGYLSFVVDDLNFNESTTVTVLLPPGTTVETYWKYGPTPDNPEPHWYEFLYNGTTGAELLSDRIVLHLVDGLLGDDDLSFNGEVTDLGGPGFARPPFLEVDLRVEPEVVKLNHGAFTVFITPPDGFDVRDLENDSLTCNGVDARAIRKTSKELVAQFPRSSIIDRGNGAGLVEVVGTLSDGTPLRGTATVPIK